MENKKKIHTEALKATLKKIPAWIFVIPLSIALALFAGWLMNRYAVRSGRIKLLVQSCIVGPIIAYGTYVEYKKMKKKTTQKKNHNP